MTTEPSGERRDPAEKPLEVGTWGVFFLWMGIALLAHLAWGLWFLGVGAIILGAQLARRMLSLRIEGFWMVAGVLFLIGGLSGISPFGLDIALIPLVCILAGAVLLIKALSHREGPRHA